MSGERFIGEVVVPDDGWEARKRARIRIPVDSPVDTWGGYRFRVDPTIPKDRFVLVGIDYDGKPWQKAVLFEEADE